MPDTNRAERTNLPEVVFARHKDTDTLKTAVCALLEANGEVLVTKASPKQASFLESEFGGRVRANDKKAGIVIVGGFGKDRAPIGIVAVLAAGSSDYFVAEEAALSAEFLGLSVKRFYDCGIAGIHRAQEAQDLIKKSDCDCVIVVAGMEGALPSVMAGSIKQPVVAVPTSVGYGTSYEGLSALLGMLNSCTPGVCVMNIDNGFGAAAFACKMIRWMRR